MRRDEPNHESTFSDYPLYRRLCDEKGCKSVEITAVCVKHNGSGSICQGLQVHYRSTFHDGDESTTRTTEAEPHFFADGTSVFRDGPFHSTWLVLEGGEYIIGLSLQQGDFVVAGITFVTNRRVLSCGGITFPTNRRVVSCDGYRGIHLLDDFTIGSTPRPSRRRIVAFAGTVCGVLQRVGYYTRPWNDSYSLSWLSSSSRSFLSFHFSASSTIIGSACIPVTESLAENWCMQQVGASVDDFPCYRYLRRQPGCKKVEISSVRIYHSNGACHGFWVKYKMTFVDGSVQRRIGGKHYEKKSETGQTGDITSTNFCLEEGEYIRGLDLKRGPVITQVFTRTYVTFVVIGMTFVTNRRVFHCGNMNHEGELIRMPAPNPGMRIVTFAANYGWEVAGRNGRTSVDGITSVGYYAKSIAWETIWHFVTIRALKQQGRAEPVPGDGPVAIIHTLVELPDVLFRDVLRYLM
jgi:hypothetical protein